MLLWLLLVALLGPASANLHLAREGELLLAPSMKGAFVPSEVFASGSPVSVLTCHPAALTRQEPC